MAKDISIITRLKKIALTSIELGREIAKEKTRQINSNLRASRAGQLLEDIQRRMNQALHGQTAAKNATPKRHTHKHHPGNAKYSAKTARLAHD